MAKNSINWNALLIIGGVGAALYFGKGFINSFKASEENVETRQENATMRTEERQEEKTERVKTRQENKTERAEDRQETFKYVVNKFTTPKINKPAALGTDLVAAQKVYTKIVVNPYAQFNQGFSYAPKADIKNTNQYSQFK